MPLLPIQSTHTSDFLSRREYVEPRKKDYGLAELLWRVSFVTQDFGDCAVPPDVCRETEPVAISSEARRGEALDTKLFHAFLAIRNRCSGSQESGVLPSHFTLSSADRTTFKHSNHQL